MILKSNNENMFPAGAEDDPSDAADFNPFVLRDGGAADGGGDGAGGQQAEVRGGRDAVTCN